MNRLKYTSLLFCLVTMIAANCQDSLKKLSASQVMQIVKLYHPVAKQAELLIENAKADILVAKGLFDPVLQHETAQKTFDGTAYYYYNRPALSIPTWFGAEITTGLEYLSGNRTDPQETKGRTSYLGITVPLAKNLWMDKRRAALQAAKIFKKIIKGEGSWAQNAVVLANAAMALNCTDNFATYSEAYQAAVASLESGMAYQCLEKLISLQ